MDAERKVEDIVAVVLRRHLRPGEPELNPDEISRAILAALYDPARRGAGQSPLYGQAIPNRAEALLRQRMGLPDRQPSPPMRVRYRMTPKSWGYIQAAILCALGAMLAFLVGR